MWGSSVIMLLANHCSIIDMQMQIANMYVNDYAFSKVF